MGLGQFAGSRQGFGKRGCGSHMFKVSITVKVTRDSLLAQTFLFSYVVLLL